MKLTRAAIYLAALAALVAWWAAASTSTMQPRPAPALSPETAVESTSESLEREISRLHDRTGRVTPPQRPARNLFHFAPPPSPDATHVTPAAPAQNPAAPAQEDAPTVPSLAFIGLAEDAGPAGTVRTAIISGAGDLFVVKEGESVTSRFRVFRISDDAVELADSDGTVLRLSLK